MYILIPKKQLNDKHRETKWQSSDIHLPFKPLGLFFLSSFDSITHVHIVDTCIWSISSYIP